MSCFPDSYSPKKSRVDWLGRESGFTLMVALGLLTTLLLIGVSLSTMASIELRKAEKKKAMVTARANARLGAVQALELLQVMTGPDQRVTAPSGLWKAKGETVHDPGSTEQYWTGVYHSQMRTWDRDGMEWVTEGRKQNEYNGEYILEDSLQPGLEKQVWLVSGQDMKDSGGNYVTPESVRSAGSKVVIHDGFRPGEPDEADVHVLAVPVPSREASKGRAFQSRFAFWISDEGTKAKVNIDESAQLQYPGKNSGAAGKVRDRLALMSPRTSPLTMFTKEGTERSEEQRVGASQKLLTPQMLKSASSLEPDAFSHHFTSNSKGVLADVARGGLKKDLSRGLGDQFKEKLAGKPMWVAPLPDRLASGKIQDLSSFRSKRDKNVNKRAPEQHRGFLRGPLWDLAHSWYSLYLPKPPYLMAFYGGVEDEFHPTKKKKQENDLVGRHDDPTIYKYSANTLNRGPKSNVSHATTPNIEPRSPGGAHANNWIFRNSFQTTKYFTNKPIWQHSNKSGQNFKIDFTKNGYPRGSNYWRNENIRHTIAPVLIEYNLEFGLMAVDGTYLWDLTHDGQGNFYPYRCDRDGYVFHNTAWRDQPGNRPPFEPDEGLDPGQNPVRTPMPVCAVCNKQDQVVYTGGYRETSRIDPRFGDNIWDPQRVKLSNVLHLDRTKFRREIVNELVRRGLTGDGTPGINGLLAHRTPKFRQWMFSEHPKDADQFYNDKDNSVNIAKHMQEFFSQHEYLDIEKHSRGLRDGNTIEQAAYGEMKRMMKPIAMVRPTLVYWNPYNVQLNNVHPFAYSYPGNVYSRWANGKIHLPDGRINTNQGPLEFYFSNNKRPVKSPDFTWMSLIRTPYVDRYTNNFTTWYGFPVPNNPTQPPFYKHDFRPAGMPNHSFTHDHTRLVYRSDIARHSKDPSQTRPYNFAPGEIKVFSSKFTRRTIFHNHHHHHHNIVISPDGDSGFSYSLPLSCRFLDASEVIQDITLYTNPAGNFEYYNGERFAGRHRHAWNFEALVQSNRDTFKKQHTNPGYMHVARLDHLIPDATSSEVVVPVGKSLDTLYPHGSRWEDYDWWGKKDQQGNNWHKDYGGIRGSSPQVDGSRGSDGYGGPKVDNDFMKRLSQVVSAQIHNHLVFGYNFRRKAADSNPGESLATWTQVNARAHNVMRNGEKDGSPFGWEGRILSRADMMKDVLSVSAGIAKWGASFSHQGKSRVAVVDVPRQPMHSLVELTNADLGQFNLAPTFAVGNSYASPFVPPDQAYSTRGKYNLYPADVPALTQENNQRNIRKFFNGFNHTVPDFSYQLNRALFDRYFFSTIPDWPYNASEAPYKNPQLVARNYPPFEEFNQQFVDRHFDRDTDYPDSYLPPNPRMEYYTSDGAPPDIHALHDMDSAAAHLLVDGSFNVNSTSVQAWLVLLQTLKGAQFKHTMGLHNNKDTTPFLRSIHPYWGSNDIWQGFSELTESQLEELAEAIVEEVRRRGPFLSMAQFINRSLVNPQDVQANAGSDPDAPPFKPWQSGPVQAALDRTVNRDKFNDPAFGDTAGYEPKAGSHWIPSTGKGGKTNATNFFLENKSGMNVASGIPGWTLQSDVLRPLAPILNARSDTFTIRGYGEVKSNGNLKAKALCEMLVQRVPEYVNNHAHSSRSEFLVHNKDRETWYDPDPGFEPGNRDRNLLIRKSRPDLMENFRLGRRYKVLEFRWL